MATMNLSGALSTATSGSFLMSAALVAGGGLLGRMGTNFLRDNVLDIGVRGGDVVYSVVAAVAVLAALPRKWSRPLALGMVGGAVSVTAQEFGVV